MRIDARIVAVLCLVGVGLIITGLIIGQPSAGIEGAYFNRSVGVPAYSGVFPRGAGLLDPADGNLWLGGGIVVLLVTTLLLLISRGRFREQLSP